ncbi:MAG: hypothetical protein ABIT83_14435 [Massilia sp.]
MTCTARARQPKKNAIEKLGLTILLSALCWSGIASAQSPAQPAPQSETAPAPAMPRSLTLNKPYQADEIEEIVKPLANGDELRQTYKYKSYRDSAGYTRRDTLDATGAVESIVLTKPDGTRYNLDPVSLKAKKFVPMVIPPAPAPAPDQPKTTVTYSDMGARQIEGFNTLGKKYTFEYPAGTRDNSKPMVGTTESWHSPDLRMSIHFTNADPIRGTSVRRVVNIKREEPPADMLSTLLSHYTMVEQLPVRPSLIYPPRLH